MKVLVIGGTGNISTQVVAALLRHEHEVTILTRGQRPVPDGVTHIQVNRHEHEAFESALQSVEAEVVIDMIAFKPADTEAALRACAGRVKQFIQTSTVMTYGPPVEGLWADETAALNAQSDYGRNKILIDQMLLERHAKGDLPVTIIKPAYTYGPGIPLHRQISDDGRWIDRLRRGLPMLSCGDGDKLFQFLPSRDAGEFYALCVGRESVLGEVVNMVHPTATTWDEWHRMAMTALGVECEIVHAPMELLLAADPKRYQVLPHNFGHTQLFSGAKAARLVPEWDPTATDRVEWVAENIRYMDAQGLVVDTTQDPDDLEDRIIAGLRGVVERVLG